MTDRIEITIETTDRVKQALEAHLELIMHEVLCISLEFEKNEGAKWDINGEQAVISLRIASAKESS